MHRVDRYPDHFLSLTQRLKFTQWSAFCTGIFAVVVFLVFWFLPLSEEVKPVATIFGSCPNGCLVRNRKIFNNLIDFDHGPCSCDRLNSNNITVTFCSDFLKEVIEVLPPKALTSVELMFLISLSSMGLSHFVFLFCA